MKINKKSVARKIKTEYLYDVNRTNLKNKTMNKSREYYENLWKEQYERLLESYSKNK